MGRQKYQNKKDLAECSRNEPQDAPDHLLTKKELAKRLRISERKIEMDHKIPRIRWERTVRYDWSEVLEYLKDLEGEGGDSAKA